MPTSVEKVGAAVDHAAELLQQQVPAILPQLQQQASGMQAIALGLVAPFLPQLLPQLVDQLVSTARGQLPDEPDALDDLLRAGARWLQSLVSDAPAVDADADELPAAA